MDRRFPRYFARIVGEEGTFFTSRTFNARRCRRGHEVVFKDERMRRAFSRQRRLDCRGIDDVQLNLAIQIPMACEFHAEPSWPPDLARLYDEGAKSYIARAFTMNRGFDPAGNCSTLPITRREWLQTWRASRRAPRRLRRFCHHALPSSRHRSHWHLLQQPHRSPHPYLYRRRADSGIERVRLKFIRHAALLVPARPAIREPSRRVMAAAVGQSRSNGLDGAAGALLVGLARLANRSFALRR